MRNNKALPCVSASGPLPIYIRQRTEAAITEFYDATAAALFMEAYGITLFDPQRFALNQGFNILVLLPPDMQVQTEALERR